MIHSEIKRILRSKVFIILTLLAIAYFAYLTVSAYRINYDSIKSSQKQANAVNEYLAQVTKDAPAADQSALFESLRQKYADAMTELNTYSETDKGEPTYDDYGNIIMSAEERALSDKYFMAQSAYLTVKYKFFDYVQLTENTVKNALELVHDTSQDTYTLRLNKKAVDKYNRQKEFALIDSTPASVWHKMYTAYYMYFYIVLAFAFVILAADVFCAENTHSLEAMVYTSKYGRQRLFCAKLCSLLFLAAVFMLVLTAADVISAYCIMGGRLLLQPVQSLEIYQSSAANISFLSLIIISGLARLLMLVFVISIAAAVSQISRKVFISLVADCLLLFVMFAFYVYSSGYMALSDTTHSEAFDSGRFNMFEKLRAFLPTCLTQPYVYFQRFDYINLANYPFLRLTTCVIVTTAATILLLLFAYFRFGNVPGIFSGTNKIERINKKSTC